jgi:hypothetical protein
MNLSKLILETVKKYLKGLGKQCQSLVTVTVTYKKRRINCIIESWLENETFRFKSNAIVFICFLLTLKNKY